MKVLLLAPQPFYQERGTPIAVDMVLRVLSERGDQVDVLTYHEGESVGYDNVTLHRTLNLPFITGIRPGFSWKKLVCDGLMLFKSWRMVVRGRYQMVHAVEEAAFIALLLKWVLKVPYAYDMDSSLRRQLIEKSFLLAPVALLVGWMEGLAVRNATAVVPVCNALAEDIGKHHPHKVVVLRDVSLLKEIDSSGELDLRSELGISAPMLMYVGNLEVYQGIDLMLEGFSMALEEGCVADLVVVGGKSTDVQKYQKKAERLNIQNRVHFLGPRPVEDLALYLSQADILVSPRIKGQNTPMKLYSYLHSGKPVLATNLATHTQVLDGNVSYLVSPEPREFAQGINSLVQSEPLRLDLGAAGKELVEREYTFSVFRNSLNGLYAWLDISPAVTSTSH